ncbi:MAG: protein-L-isoaspartate(D-aspartate) O-methyltransferase [Gammaproteobacteria bacterium]|nr:protein-L-isoaspartate(D-aspartate) O-methyltransferase [Gammaproteobacteria bacterium]NIR82853.1 protein-L-isoaspartate(D-aspartate) O-methyltransferase [Gammaproteobacteria bacterium]NIR89962.1 protein-L-isoaspartate(D-aspartate) O-methyltransferase [Gammaproteobacteria bacterium]NIU04011.1 protein-L-isoaspartate(D-aspartate) O-methyltransferase [Gammaproteobacteria bacterium]NIV51331.1 protein-L-isoaspartate(D-aspartate) O-methyltransferase [Gammaproteobacteria bacterium]
MTSQRTRDRLVGRLRDEGIQHPLVLAAVQEVPRHIFVEEALASRAYEDSALPIGHGQTISQPYVVARMTEALLDSCSAPERVLEIGTGSGYQTAVLARIAGRIYTIERHKGLLDRARERLHALGVHNMRMRHADGYAGWPEHAPYAGIIVTAAPNHVPDSLCEQLAPNGRLVLPVGVGGMQRLLIVTRTDHGYEEQFLEHVSFVPMVAGTS